MRHWVSSGKPAARDPYPQVDASFAARQGASRREILQWLAIGGATSALPASGLLAQSAAPAGRIDVHHHVVPPFYVKEMEKEIAATGHPAPPWSPAASIEAMDKYGVATSMLSPMTRVVQDSMTDKSERARTLARKNNDYQAQMVTDYPGRFGNFAALPLPDTDGSLREMEYAFSTLKADGVAIWTSYRDKWPGDPAFAPVFEELNRRKAIVFIHPAAALCCRSIQPGVADSVVEYDFDVARAVTSFLKNDSIRRYPNIRFIIPHSGGTLPVLANRISEVLPDSRSEKISADIIGQLKLLYYEVAHATYAAPLSAAIKLIPLSQFMFGSDYPIVPYPFTTTNLDSFGFSPPDLHAVNRGNAERLFPRLKA